MSSAISSSTKAKLKQIQKHIKSEEFESAVTLSKEVLNDENGQGTGAYNALVFAGLSLSKLGKPQEAEKVYIQATTLFPDQALAFQGLGKLYEGEKDWEKLGELEKNCLERCYEKGDADGTSKHFQKLVSIVQDHGTRGKLVAVMEALTPSSVLYNWLHSQLDISGSGSSPYQDNPTSTTIDPSSAGTYVPWSIPPFPPPPKFSTQSSLSTPSPVPSSFTPNPSTYVPHPFPPLTQILRDSQTSLSLLVTLTLIVEYDQRVEEEKEVSKRRKRLGAGGEKEVRRAVGRDMLSTSRLPELYEEILGHPAAGEEVRRAAEGKLLRYWYRFMTCLSRSPPSISDPKKKEETTQPQTGLDIFGTRPKPAAALPLKDEIRAKVEEMIKGMILLKVVDEAAWNLDLEWKDVGGLDLYDLNFLYTYMELFPDSPVSSLIEAYCRYFGYPLPSDETKVKRRRKDKDDQHAPETDSEIGTAVEASQRPDPFNVFVSSISAMPKSIFAHRVMAEAYLREQDWENLIAVAEKGISLTKASEIESGKKMIATRASFDVYLGTGLVHYFSPKHHPRALKLLEGVLQLDPNAITCLMGRGSIFQAQGEYAAARKDFQRVLNLETAGASEDQPFAGSDAALKAGEEIGWCLVKEDSLQDGKVVLEKVATALENLPGQEVAASRVEWRIGVVEWEMGAEFREEAHDHFVSSLKINPSFPPAFTSLGIWYLEGANPPDEVRASKCFQKAFELDATEAEAARRLAVGYAKEGEWALVNTIAKRVIEGEGGLEGGLSGKESGTTASKFIPTNAWAFKALGAVQMVYKKFTEAAQSFQVALRVDNDDSALWIRLGEAYSRSGRHVAAIKSLSQGIELDPQNWLAHFHLGNIHRELASFGPAISAYRRAAELLPNQPGISLALALTLLDRGREEQTMGFHARACESYIDCLDALKPTIADASCKHTSWKLVAETCLHLSDVACTAKDFKDSLAVIRPAMEHLISSDDAGASTIAKVASPQGVLDGSPDCITIAKASVCAYAWRARLLRFDNRVAEPPLFDLASALHHLKGLVSQDDSSRAPATRAALLLIRKALDSDPASATLWHAFGILAKDDSAQLAQHAFVVSLELEPRNPAVWCNLAFLYLDLGDPALAFQLFYKAQTLDPENPLAWLGQAMTAEATGNDEKAENLYAHATVLSTGSLLPAGLGTAKEALRGAAADPVLGVVDDFHPISFALSRYCDKYSSDAAAQLLHAIILERLGQFEPAIVRARSSVRLLEAEYERAESPEVERRYALSLLTLGRLQLAASQESEAIDSFNDCINLLVECSDPEGTAARSQARLALAIALSRDVAQLEPSLEAFETAIADANTISSEKSIRIAECASVALAKSLWSLGDDDAREAAQTHLLEAFSQETHSVAALTTLAAIGVLNGDPDVLDAVRIELSSMDEDEKRRQGPSLIVKAEAYAWLSEGNLRAAESALGKAVVAQPFQARPRIDLSHLLIQPVQTEQTTTARSALGLISRLDTSDKISSEELADIEIIQALLSSPSLSTDIGQGESPSVAAAQRAIHLRPWDQGPWLALATATI